MIGLRRHLSLLAIATAALSTPVFAADEVSDTFSQGVSLLERGQNEEALKIFQQVLAMDPSHDAAYELWLDTDHDIWLKMLVLSGEYEQVAKRFMNLASTGRKERANDPDAIRELLQQLNTDDVGARHRATQTLSANHGEYAVPLLVYGLANQDDGDRRVIYMQTLIALGGDTVPPLIEALDSPDPFLRRNVALTLGYIGDPRANGVLAALAARDEDGGVKAAATEALASCGGTTDALGQLLAQGNAYHNHDHSVVKPHLYSDVVWHWAGTGIETTEVPRFLYTEEMAKKAYYRALDLAPGSVEALAGIARVSVSESGLVEEWAAAGADAGDWMDRLAADELAVGVAGTAALDVALGWSLEQQDLTAGIGLCRALGRSASAPTPNLQKALTGDRSGAIRGEAAVALGRIAYHSTAVASPAVVEALGQAASREVLQIAGIIDGDAGQSAAFAQALTGANMMVNQWTTGARGLVSLRAIPGLDVLLIADHLPDLTLHQVIAEVRDDPRMAETPILVITADADAAGELYGDKVQGFVGSAEDSSVVTDAMSGNLNRDREQANDLAGRAAHVLAALAGAGDTDVSSTANALAGTLATRPDPVVVPVLAALGRIGGAAHIAPIAEVVADGNRSDEARTAAAQCLAGVFVRHSQVDDGTLQSLLGVCSSDASFGIRSAVATALGRLTLTDEMRAAIMKSVRANVSE